MKIHVVNKNLTKWLATAALAFILMGTAADAETVDGFVTRIDSPTEFNVGTLHVVIDGKTQCIATKTYLGPPGPDRNPNITRYFVHSLGKNRRNIPCNTKHIAQYSRIHLYGFRESSNGDFIAYKLTSYNIVLDISNTKLNDGIVLEEDPIWSKSKPGLIGKIWMDGYPIFITPQTLLLPEPTDTTFRFGFHFTKIAAHAELPSKTQFSSAVPLRENTCVVFHSDRTLSGHTTATKLQFWPNWIDAKEKMYDKKFITKIQAPDYSEGIPGTIQYKGSQPITILPNKEIQAFVSRLGDTLIPAYQKNLLDSDAAKFHFHFYVVHTFPARLGAYFVETNGRMPEYQSLYWDRSCYIFYNRPKANAMVRNIVAAPDGTILIPDVILGELRNSAQLATLLSTAITSVVQRQDYHAWPKVVVSTFWKPSPYDTATNWNVGSWQNEQALRIGIRQMYLAGYDIREAPFAWAVAQGKPVNNPVINSKHPDKEIPWYAAYAFNYISHYYKDVDYSKLKRGEKEYQQFLQELYKADPSLPHPKVATTPASKK